MNLRNLEYLIQEAFIGIWRNGIMAVASVSTVALSMAVLGAFVLLVFGSHRLAERRLAEFEIRVFTPRGVSREHAERVRDAIRALPLAKRVELKSRDEEWTRFKRGRDLQMAVGGVVGNPLPYALDVECKDSRKTAVLADQIRRIDGVRKVNNAEENYRHVRSLADLVKILGFAAALVLCLTTVFIISNAIRLTLYARRQEIKIMQLVGATNWFIRVPLVLEGIVIGAIGAAVASGLIEAGSSYIASAVSQGLPMIVRDLSSGVERTTFVALVIAGGAMIGALGSMISIRRFLKI